MKRLGGKTNAFPRDYYCICCKLNFNTRDEFRLHREEYHEGGYICPICRHVNARFESFKRHYKNKHSESCKVYKCEGCDYSAISNCELKRHVQACNRKKRELSDFSSQSESEHVPRVYAGHTETLLTKTVGEECERRKSNLILNQISPNTSPDYCTNIPATPELTSDASNYSPFNDGFSPHYESNIDLNNGGVAASINVFDSRVNSCNPLISPSDDNLYQVYLQPETAGQPLDKLKSRPKSTLNSLPSKKPKFTNCKPKASEALVPVKILPFKKTKIQFHCKSCKYSCHDSYSLKRHIGIIHQEICKNPSQDIDEFIDVKPETYVMPKVTVSPEASLGKPFEENTGSSERFQSCRAKVNEAQVFQPFFKNGHVWCSTDKQTPKSLTPEEVKLWHQRQIETPFIKNKMVVPPTEHQIEKSFTQHEMEKPITQQEIEKSFAEHEIEKPITQQEKSFAEQEIEKPITQQAKSFAEQEIEKPFTQHQNLNHFAKLKTKMSVNQHESAKGFIYLSNEKAKSFIQNSSAKHMTQRNKTNISHPQRKTKQSRQNNVAKPSTLFTTSEPSILKELAKRLISKKYTTKGDMGKSLNQLETIRPLIDNSPTNPLNQLEVIRPLIDNSPTNPVHQLETIKPLNENSSTNPINQLETKRALIRNPPTNPFNQLETKRALIGNSPTNPINQIETIRPLIQNPPIKPLNQIETIKPLIENPTTNPLNQNETLKQNLYKPRLEPVFQPFSISPFIRAETLEPVSATETLKTPPIDHETATPMTMGDKTATPSKVPTIIETESFGPLFQTEQEWPFTRIKTNEPLRKTVAYFQMPQYQMVQSPCKIKLVNPLHPTKKGTAKPKTFNNLREVFFTDVSPLEEESFEDFFKFKEMDYVEADVQPVMGEKYPSENTVQLPSFSSTFRYPNIYNKDHSKSSYRVLNYQQTLSRTELPDLPSHVKDKDEVPIKNGISWKSMSSSSDDEISTAINEVVEKYSLELPIANVSSTTIINDASISNSSGSSSDSDSDCSISSSDSVFFANHSQQLASKSSQIEEYCSDANLSQVKLQRQTRNSKPFDFKSGAKNNQIHKEIHHPIQPASVNPGHFRSNSARLKSLAIMYELEKPDYFQSSALKLEQKKGKAKKSTPFQVTLGSCTGNITLPSPFLKIEHVEKSTVENRSSVKFKSDRENFEPRSYNEQRSYQFANQIEDANQLAVKPSEMKKEPRSRDQFTGHTLNQFSFDRPTIHPSLVKSEMHSYSVKSEVNSNEIKDSPILYNNKVNQSSSTPPAFQTKLPKCSKLDFQDKSDVPFETCFVNKKQNCDASSLDSRNQVELNRDCLKAELKYSSDKHLRNKLPLPYSVHFSSISSAFKPCSVTSKLPTTDSARVKKSPEPNLNQQSVYSYSPPPYSAQTITSFPPFPSRSVESQLQRNDFPGLKGLSLGTEFPRYTNLPRSFKSPLAHSAQSNSSSTSKISNESEMCLIDYHDFTHQDNDFQNIELFDGSSNLNFLYDDVKPLDTSETNYVIVDPLEKFLT